MAEIIKNDALLDVGNQSNLLINPIREEDILEVDDSELEDVAEEEVIEEEYTEDNVEIEDDEDESVKETNKKSTKPPKQESKSEITDNKSVDNPITYLGLSLKESGILSDVDDEDFDNLSSLEDLTELVDKQIGSRVNEWKDSYITSNLIQNLVKDGYIRADQVNVGYTVKESDIKDEKTAERFVENYYKLEGYKDREIQKLISRSTDIIEDAKELVPEYNKVQEQLKEEAAKSVKKREQEQEQAREKLLADIDKNIQSVSEFIPGRKINSTTKEKISKNVVNTWQKVNNDVAKYAPILAYLDHYGMLDGKFDSIAKAAESESTKKLKSLLDNKPVKPSNSYIKRVTARETDESLIEALQGSLKTK